MINYLVDSKARADINDLANQIGNTFSEVQAVSNVFTLDLSENINFQLTLDDGVAKSFVFSNIPSDSGRIINITARIICTVESALNVPASVMWQNGIAPAYIAKNKYLLMFTSYDAGETWDGSWVGAWAGAWAMPPEIIVFDDFNRADNATSLGDAVTGQTWQYSTDAVFGISNNQAKSYSNGTDIAFIDSGVSDATISVKFLTASALNYLIFRYTDINNYCVAGRSEGDVAWHIAKIQNGNFSEDDMSYVLVENDYVSGDECKVVLNGSDIKLYVNDTLIANKTDTFNQTATKHGLISENSLNSYFDDFKVEV